MKHKYLIIGLIVLAGLTSVATYADESPWPMFRHDRKHTGYTPYTGPATPTVAWTFQANDGITSSPSIGHDGTIYVGAGGYYDRFGYNTGGKDSSLYAIYPDGSLKWQFKTDKGSYTAGIFSSPAIGSDGTIYVGALDHYLYALEDAGSYANLKWKVQVGANSVYASPTLGDDGTIYVGCLDQKFYALRPEDGSWRWYHIAGWCVFSSAAIIEDGTIYVGSKDHRLYSFEDSVTYGKVRWKYTTGPFYNGHLVDSSPAVGSDGTIYFGTDPYGAWGKTPIPVDTSFWAVNPDGTLKWAFETGDGVESTPAIGPDGTIYFGSFDSCLYAITDNGNEGVMKWKFRTNGPIDCSPTVDGAGIIYFGSRDSTLYALYPDGSVRWTFQAAGGFESSPTIDGNGYLYIGSFDGNLYSLGTGAPDVGVVSIHVPGEVKTDSTYLPLVTVRNYRATPQTFDVACLIDTQGYYVYGDTVQVSGLTGGGISHETFSPWNVGSDSGIVYSITTLTLLPSDDNVINDTLFKEVVSVGQIPFVRGDVNGDGLINIADVMHLLNYLFIGGPPPEPLEAGDANCDGAVDIADEVYLVNYLFVGGPPPAC